MAPHRIAEAADATGFSADTLRYYERIGLLTPAERSPAGYRLYDDADLETLGFIGDAKTAGLSLDEIAELVGLRDAGDCAPVRDRLHELVCARADAARTQAGDLAGFAARLDALASRLAGTDPPARCGPDCGCSSPVPVELTEGPADPACTLPAEQWPDRLAVWRDLLTAGEVVEATDKRARVHLPPDPEHAARAAELAMLEQDCCGGSLAFTIDVTPEAVLLEARGPQVASLLAATGGVVV